MPTPRQIEKIERRYEVIVEELRTRPEVSDLRVEPHCFVSAERSPELWNKCVRFAVGEHDILIVDEREVGAHRKCVIQAWCSTLREHVQFFELADSLRKVRRKANRIVDRLTDR